MWYTDFDKIKRSGNNAVEDIAKPICEEKGIAIDDFMIEVQEV